MRVTASVILGLVAMLGPARSAVAQTMTSPATAKTILPSDEYATSVLRDPWNMAERTDLGWFTWGTDLPASNMSSKRMTTDGLGQSIFTGQPDTGSNDPSIFLLDPHPPGTTAFGRTGRTFPIATNRFVRLLVKMRIANEIKPPDFGAIGTVPVMQVYWSRDTIYFDPTLRPAGGTYTTVDAMGNQVGIPFSSLTSDPGGAMEGGHYVIRAIPLGDIGALQALNPNLVKWKNVNANNPAVDVNWGDSAAIVGDSLRFKPVNLNGTFSGTVDIDWIRLVEAPAGAAETVSWSGGGAYDVVVSTAADCGAADGNYAVVAYNRTTGFQFHPEELPNGRYYVGLRDRLTANGPDVPASRQIRACSSAAGGSYTVIDYPSMTFSAPSPDGSADDFATVFLGNPWDFDSTGDIDFTRNVPSLWPATVPAEWTDGTSLGEAPLIFGSSAPAAPETPTVGDPHLYMLYSIGRGRNTRVDTTRYRLLTFDFGVDRARDLAAGSVLRVVWHIAGETWFTGQETADAENVSTDVPLRHMKKGVANTDTESARYVLDHVRLDLADRRRVPIEDVLEGAPSVTGWSNTALQCGGTGCADERVQPFDRVGLDNFRLDPHEFPAPTDFFVRLARLAAHERTGSTYQIAWTSTLPPVPSAGPYADPSAWHVRLYAVRTVPESSPGAGDASPSTPITSDCTANPGSDTFAITSGGTDPSLAAGQYSWSTAAPGGLVPGALYFVCAGIIPPGAPVPEVFTLSEWPVIYAPSASTAPLPRLFADRTSIHLAATHTGAGNPPNLSSKTPPQRINITQVGGGSSVGWLVDVCENHGPTSTPACTGSVDYLQLSATSGSGSGWVTVQVKDSSVLPASTGGTAFGVLLRIHELAGGTMANSPQYVQLWITIYGPGDATQAPVGQVDVPAQGGAGLQGTIGVSGWAIDDVGLSSVTVYRNCLNASEPGACLTGIVPGAPATQVVFIGEVDRVAGARPDVEAAFNGYPGTHTAGWGFAILTNMLPRTAGPFSPFGGQGPVTFYVVATDVDGHATLLGRSWSVDHDPTSITLDNDTIAKPFGAIDTPSQGGPASGMGFANFGWAITPDDGTGIGIPDTGATMWVFVDGLPVGNVTYNQCRGTVGNPVPPGTYCNDDVSSIFGNATPQPPGTSRVSNPSVFRNLDAARGPQGSFVLDTTGYANGLHTIAWSVTDSGGRIEGIGSRYFQVENSSPPPSPDASPLAPPGPELGVDLEDLAALGRVGSPVGARVGWALDAPLAPATLDAGLVRVAAGSGQRLELGLPDTGSGSAWRGYALRHGRLELLPAGSALERSGRFAWQPMPGYFGDYDLLFVRSNAGGARELLPVRVTLGALSR
jgi:hypothetical protein